MDRRGDLRGRREECGENDLILRVQLLVMGKVDMRRLL